MMFRHLDYTGPLSVCALLLLIVMTNPTWYAVAWLIVGWEVLLRVWKLDMDREQP